MIRRHLAITKHGYNIQNFYKMKEISSKFVGLKTRPIRVKVPASVAYDFGKMTKITESILGKLGCPGCHSGFDIRFDIERDFIFNERLEIVKGM